MTTTQVTSWCLNYSDGTSDKFYNVHLFASGYVVLNWGRNGTSGQTKIEKYTPSEADIIAKRQVYAKAGKGYKVETNEFTWAMTQSSADRTIKQNYGCSWLNQEMRAAKADSQFTQQQRLVTTHYDTFIEQTNQVLDAAAGGEEFDTLLDRWQKLSAAWAELDDKHEHARAAVGMVQQVVSQKMMGV